MQKFRSKTCAHHVVKGGLIVVRKFASERLEKQWQYEI
jgi:hypothetical protein